MSGIVGRIQPKIKESQTLEYEYDQSKNYVMRHSPEHRIGNSPRKT